MQDLWRLSAADIAGLVKSKKISAKEAASAALARLDAVNPTINAVVDHRPADVLAQAAAVDAAIARGEDAGSAGGRAGHRQGQYRPGRLCHHQRPQTAARRHREEQQPGDRQSAQSRRRHSRAHQLPGVLLSLVHHQSDSWRHQKSARPGHHAGRLVRRGRGGGRGRHRPYRARHRHRRIDPLSRLCLRRAWPAADDRPHRGLQRGAAGTPDRAADHARYRARWRAPSAISGSRWPRCRPRTPAIPGGCRRRSKDRRCRSASRCASTRTVSIPCRK